MNKQEFLNILKQRLTGEVSAAVIEDNMCYYSEYFEQQLADGKTEREILDLLGDPNLLARTIIDTHGNDSGREVYEDTPQQDKAHIHHVKIPSIVFWVIVLVAAVAAAAVFIRLLPVILLAGTVIYLVSRIGKRR